MPNLECCLTDVFARLDVHPQRKGVSPITLHPKIVRTCVVLLWKPTTSARSGYLLDFPPKCDFNAFRVGDFEIEMVVFFDRRAIVIIDFILFNVLFST